MRALEKSLPKSQRSMGSSKGSSKGSSAASAAGAAGEGARQPRLPNLDALRSKLGLGPRDHLAAAAARVDAAEAATSAATQLPAADFNAASSGRPSPAPSSAADSRPAAGSDAPLSTVVVRAQADAQAQAGVPARPSWAARDPGAQAAPKSGIFGSFFSKKS